MHVLHLCAHIALMCTNCTYVHILHSCAFLNLKKTRFDAIIEFLRMADTAQVDRQDWCEKSFNILASKMTPTIADKHTIGSLLNNDYDIWSETDKEKFAQKIRCFPKMHTPNRVRFTSLMEQLENLLRQVFKMISWSSMFKLDIYGD